MFYKIINLINDNMLHTPTIGYMCDKIKNIHKPYILRNEQNNKKSRLQDFTEGLIFSIFNKYA